MRPTTSPVYGYGYSGNANGSVNGHGHTMSSSVSFVDNRDGQTPAQRRASVLVGAPHSARDTQHDMAMQQQPQPADNSVPITTGSFRRSRNSILSLGALRFPRRPSTSRKPSQPMGPPASPRTIGMPQQTIMLPGVLDIRARDAEEEDAERERLRDAAAQSLGLDIGSVVSPPSIAPLYEDEGTTSTHDLSHDVDVMLTPTAPVSTSAPAFPGSGTLSRNRTASLAAKPTFRRTKTDVSAIVSTPLPAYPTTVSALAPITQHSGSAAKHTGAGAIASVLGRPWKARYIALSGPPRACLHLFKSSGSEEREVGRLALQDDSVAYIAEEEVAGRKNFLRVTGKDVGAPVAQLQTRKDKDGMASWILHFNDPADMHKWIATIKSAVAQRASKSSSASQTGTVSSSVDLEIPAKSAHLYPSPTRSTFSADSASTSSVAVGRPQQAPSLRSGSTGPSAVSALRGLFTSRPRSPSTGTLDGRATPDHSAHQPSLLGMLSSVNPDVLSRAEALSPTAPPSTSDTRDRDHQHFNRRVFAPHNGQLSPIPSATEPVSPYLDRRIVADQEAALAAADDVISLGGTLQHQQSTAAKSRTRNRASVMSGALQPPPRKRPWTMLSAPPGTIPLGVDTYTTFTPTSTLPPSAIPCGDFANSSTSPPTSPSALSTPLDTSQSDDIPDADDTLGPSAWMSGGGAGIFGTPEQPARAPSLYSVSTLASADQHSTSVHSSDRSRRWSSRGLALPKRNTPPAGPPPAIPSSLAIPEHPFAKAGRPKSAGAAPSPSPTTTPASMYGNSPAFGFPPALPTTPGSSRRMSTPASTISSSSRHQVPAAGATGAIGLGLVNGTSPSSISPQRRTSLTGRFTNKRASMPPPPRPAPNAALPPTPLARARGQSIGDKSTPPIIKTTATPFTLTPPLNTATTTVTFAAEPQVPPLPSIHSSPLATPGSPSSSPRTPVQGLVRRALRLSLKAQPPGPPPATALPAPPIERTSSASSKGSKGHTRRASLGSTPHTPTSRTLSPLFNFRPTTPTSLTRPPPPPALPSSPTLASTPSNTSTLTRGQSIRARLRHLSSPMPSSPISHSITNPNGNGPTTDRPRTPLIALAPSTAAALALSDSRAPSPAPSSVHPYALPPTPTSPPPSFGERIVPRPADLDLLAEGPGISHNGMSTPPLPNVQSPSPLPIPILGLTAEECAGMRSLPPPPRRGSRQLTLAERDRIALANATGNGLGNGHGHSKGNSSSSVGSVPSTPAAVLEEEDEEARESPATDQSSSVDPPGKLVRQLSSFSLGLVTTTV